MSRLQPFKKVERRLAGKLKPKTSSKAAARMAQVRRAGTKPELIVRAYLSARGVRYRTQNRDLPGSPDLANRTRQWAIFVHGCFWHQHTACRFATKPKSNAKFWKAKFDANRARDRRARKLLAATGFRVATLWECEVTSERKLQRARDVIESG